MRKEIVYFIQADFDLDKLYPNPSRNPTDTYNLLEIAKKQHPEKKIAIIQRTTTIDEKFITEQMLENLSIENMIKTGKR